MGVRQMCGSGGKTCAGLGVRQRCVSGGRE